MRLCGCNLKEKLDCSNGIKKETILHQIRITEAATKKRFVESLK